MDGYSSDMNIHQGFPSKRYARIETHDFPEKFSIISRLKKENFMVGPGGDILKSSVLPQVQVKVPEGAVSSGTKIILQVNTLCPLLFRIAFGGFDIVEFILASLLTFGSLAYEFTRTMGYGRIEF